MELKIKISKERITLRELYKKYLKPLGVKTVSMMGESYESSYLKHCEITYASSVSIEDGIASIELCSRSGVAYGQEQENSEPRSDV